ncbi:arylesterase [Methylophaga sp.]|uniref:arylesterase n=1 Tax=Methylophaga sp. TaxID=2024840 RepID=UPI003F695112
MPRNTALLKHGLLVLLLIVVSACSDNESIRLEALSDDAVILAFGDSLTYGTGANHQTESYPAVLTQLSGKQVINAGIPGEVSQEGVARLDALLAKYQPDLVLLCHGGNDLIRKHDVDSLKHNLSIMIKKIRESGAEVVMLSVPKPGVFLKPAQLYQQVAIANGVLLENDIISDIESNNALKSDAIHPNAAGYQLLAEAVQTLLLRHGALN